MNDSKKSPLSVVDSARSSVRAGQLLVDAVCRKVSFWQKAVRYSSSLRSHHTTRRQPDPEPILAQLFFMFTSGVILSDAESFGHDFVLRELLGLEEIVDEQGMRAWLIAQNDATVTALRQLNTELVKGLIEEAPPGRTMTQGQLEIFFGRRQLQIRPQWQYDRINLGYAPGFSFQTLWAGPFILDAILDETIGQFQNSDDHRLAELLKLHQGTWQQRTSYFHGDSSCSRKDYLNTVAAAGFTCWSITADREINFSLEMEMDTKPAQFWKPAEPTNPDYSAYGMLYKAQPLAVARLKNADLHWKYTYLILPTGVENNPRKYFLRHASIDGKEQIFSDMLTDIPIDRPPCEELIANRVFYSVAILAFNILVALKTLALPDETQTWRARRLMQGVLSQPIRKTFHGGYHVRQISVSEKWRPVYEQLLKNWVPRRKRKVSGKDKGRAHPGSSL